MKLHKASPGEPAKVHITAKKNDTFSYEITGYSRNGSPYDFTNHTFILQVKKRGAKDTDPALIDMTNDSFSITQDANGTTAGVSNVVIIEHPKEKMIIKPGDYIYDIEMTDGAGKTQTFQEGDFRLTQDTSG